MKIKEKAKKVASHVWKHKWTYMAVGVGAAVLRDDLRLRKALNKTMFLRALSTASEINANAVAGFREGGATMVDGLKSHVLDDMKEGTELTGIIFYTKKDR